MPKYKGISLPKENPSTGYKREQKPREKGHSVQVFLKDDKIKCGYCDSNRCYHVKFAITLPEVQREFERRKRLGLKVPDISYLEEIS